MMAFKKKVLVASLISAIFSSASCGTIFDRSIPEEISNKLMTNLNKKDIEGVKKMFSSNSYSSIDNFDEQLELLVSFYDKNASEVVRTTNTEGKEMEYGKAIHWFNFYSFLKAEDFYYQFYIKYTHKDSYDKKNEGIWPLYCEKCEGSSYDYLAKVADLNLQLGITIKENEEE